MPWLIAVYLDIHQTNNTMQARLRTHTMETSESDIAEGAVELSLYRIPDGVSQRDWLKDVLVQVIEQL